jgi:hypothetical protein
MRTDGLIVPDNFGVGLKLLDDSGVWRPTRAMPGRPGRREKRIL